MLASLADSLPRLFQRADTLLSPHAPLVTRLVFGQAFVVLGYGKFQNLEKVVGFFTELGIPLPGVQAPMVAGFELVGGILLLLGLGTRAAALVLATTLAVALATADRDGLLQGFWFGESFANVAPLPFLVGLLWLIAKGPGKISLDHRIGKRYGVA